MRYFIALILCAVGAPALAERPAHDRLCECSCAQTPPVPGRAPVAPSDQSLTPRPLPREDRDAPHPFDTPSQAAPSTPGVPTPTPWRE